MTASAEVRQKLVNALRFDLVPPRPGLNAPVEILNQSPSHWYLTGFPSWRRPSEGLIACEEPPCSTTETFFRRADR